MTAERGLIGSRAARGIVAPRPLLRRRADSGRPSGSRASCLPGRMQANETVLLNSWMESFRSANVCMVLEGLGGGSSATHATGSAPVPIDIELAPRPPDRFWLRLARCFYQRCPAGMSPATKPKVVAMIVASAIIMQQIDATVITTALPQMAISLNSDPVALSVAVTPYLLSVAVFIPVSGWAAGRFRGRTVFRRALGLFPLGSVFFG